MLEILLFENNNSGALSWIDHTIGRYCSIGILNAILQTQAPISVYRSSQCSTTGISKAVVCAILYVGWCI